MTITVRLILIGLVATAGACALLPVPSFDDGPQTSRPIADARLQVVNLNWLDVVIYVDNGGRRVRLGSVTSLDTERMTFPATIVQGGSMIRLIASPIGSTEVHVTEPIQVGPGQIVEFQIQNHLPISSVAVWSSE